MAAVPRNPFIGPPLEPLGPEEAEGLPQEEFEKEMQPWSPEREREHERKFQPQPVLTP